MHGAIGLLTAVYLVPDERMPRQSSLLSADDGLGVCGGALPVAAMFFDDAGHLDIFGDDAESYRYATAPALPVLVAVFRRLPPA